MYAKKIGIVLALLKRAKLLVLDEPTSGLDPKSSNEFNSLLKAVANECRSVFMVTHDIYRAKTIGTRIGIIKSGALLETFDTKYIVVLPLALPTK